jgi:hypothetical protein
MNRYTFGTAVVTCAAVIAATGNDGWGWFLILAGLACL